MTILVPPAQVRILGKIRTCAPMSSAGRLRSPSVGDEAGTPLTTVPFRLDVRELGRLARQRRLAVRDRSSLLDLAAVGITKLAWRNSLVEDWHSVRYRRIGQAEMMRANAATTRAVRQVLLRHRPHDPAGLFTAVATVIADPNRRLPDGRRIREFAPDEVQYATFRYEATAVCREWAEQAARHGVPAVLLAVACEAGRGTSRRWWLGPDWATVVAEFVALLQNPSRWKDPALAVRARTAVLPGDLPEPEQLGRLLVAGPDLLRSAWAVFCLRAGIGELLPRWWEQPAPVPRRPVGERLDG